jgi:DNA replication protein DnaC
MFKLLERLYVDEHFDMEIKYPEEFEWEIVDACKGEDGDRASRLLTRLSDVPILAIDDFLAAKTTERVRGFFFGLFDKRIRSHRPTFITTQLTSKEVVSKMSDRSDPASVKTAEAFLRRLKENTKIVNFK